MDIEELHKIECHALPGSGLVVRTVSVAQLLKTLIEQSVV